MLVRWLKNSLLLNSSSPSHRNIFIFLSSSLLTSNWKFKKYWKKSNSFLIGKTRWIESNYLPYRSQCTLFKKSLETLGIQEKGNLLILSLLTSASNNWLFYNYSLYKHSWYVRWPSLWCHPKPWSFILYDDIIWLYFWSLNKKSRFIKIKNAEKAICTRDRPKFSDFKNKDLIEWYRTISILLSPIWVILNLFLLPTMMEC